MPRSRLFSKNPPPQASLRIATIEESPSGAYALAMSEAPVAVLTVCTHRQPSSSP